MSDALSLETPSGPIGCVNDGLALCEASDFCRELVCRIHDLLVLCHQYRATAWSRGPWAFRLESLPVEEQEQVIREVVHAYRRFEIICYRYERVYKPYRQRFIAVRKEPAVIGKWRASSYHEMPVMWGRKIVNRNDTLTECCLAPDDVIVRELGANWDELRWRPRPKDMPAHEILPWLEIELEKAKASPTSACEQAHAASREQRQDDRPILEPAAKAILEALGSADVLLTREQLKDMKPVYEAGAGDSKTVRRHVKSLREHGYVEVGVRGKGVQITKRGRERLAGGSEPSE